MDEEVVVDLGALDDAGRRRLATVVGRAIDAGCTIARSVDDCIELSTTVDGRPTA